MCCPEASEGGEPGTATPYHEGQDEEEQQQRPCSASLMPRDALLEGVDRNEWMKIINGNS